MGDLLHVEVFGNTFYRRSSVAQRSEHQETTSLKNCGDVMDLIQSWGSLDDAKNDGWTPLLTR